MDYLSINLYSTKTRENFRDDPEETDAFARRTIREHADDSTAETGGLCNKCFYSRIAHAGLVWSSSSPFVWLEE